MSGKGEPPSYSSGISNQGYRQEPGVGYSQPSHYGNPQTIVVTQPTQNYIMQPVNDNMGLAIFATLCCFWPTGIIAIMRASEARTLASRGDINGANVAAQGARQLSLISVGVGVAVFVIMGIVLGVYFGIYWNYCFGAGCY